MGGRTFSYWELACGIPTLARTEAFAKPVADLDVLIVGAGFAGSWLAYFLKKKKPKLNILIVERDAFNLGASARNAGFLSCGNISEWLEDSKEFSWEETMATLRARIDGINIIRNEFGNSMPSHRCGSIDGDPLTDEKRDLIQKFNRELKEQGHDPIFEENEVTIGEATRLAAFNNFDGEVNPCELLLALHNQLAENGVKFSFECHADQLRDGEALMTRTGKSFSLKYHYAFVCTNAFTRHLAPKTAVIPVRGQILVTSPCQTPTTKSLGFFRSGYDYFRFIGDRVLVGGGRLSFKEQENTETLDVTPQIEGYLKQLAERVTGHANFTIDYHWSGIMGLRKGKHASISDLNQRVSLDDKTEEVAGFGGWGVTLTPYVMKRRAERW